MEPPRARTILITRSPVLRARAMALARLRGELDHIRPKLHKCVARSRPFLGARTTVRPHDGRGASAPWHLVLSNQLLKGPCARAPLTARPREPIKTRFWAPI
ncbi:hypothetical protein PIB30_063297 [Stylosanthes scabra]|uniref:Uncharacterized protein n=1 Tax=Stylosanthes scabra TaxID=79078 RepID=A0ABU6YKS7_9FABA|nr:hypothetical protein [Stylosanthes scabra]